MTQSISDRLSAATWRRSLVLRPCLSLFCGFLAIDCIAYTEICYDYFAFREEGERHTSSNSWRRYDDSNSEVDVIYDKSSIFYYKVPKDYVPLVATTNVSVFRNQQTWDVIRTQTAIVESNMTGWVVSASGFQSNLWYKVFEFASNYYSYYEMTDYAGTLSHSIRQGIRYTITIRKSSGMPKNPSWTAGADDGQNSMVRTTSPYPEKYSWMRRYFPNASALDFDAMAMTTGANGMKVYESALLNKNPNDPNSKLVCQLLFIDGKYRPFISIQQDFEQFGFIVRSACKKSLSDKEWFYASNWDECDGYNFFKAVVTLGEE